MNRLIGSTIGMALAASAAVAQEVPTAPQGFHFDTALSGAQEVPAVASPGAGTFSIDFDAALAEAQYTLEFSGTGSPATAAHLHCAPAGVVGAVVVPLTLPGADGGQQPLTNDDVQALIDDPACGATINNLASVLAAILDHRIYVNVHTEGSPDGELRGQLFTGAEDSGDDTNGEPPADGTSQ